MERWQITAWFASGWTALFALTYVALVRSQHSHPVPWFLLLLTVTVLLLGIAATGRVRRGALATAVVLLGLAALAGLLSIGLLLVPALVAAGFALAGSRPRPQEAAGPDDEA